MAWEAEQISMILGRYKRWKSTERDGGRQRTEQSEGRNVARFLSFRCPPGGTLLESQRQEACPVGVGGAKGSAILGLWIFPAKLAARRERKAVCCRKVHCGFKL